MTCSFSKEFSVSAITNIENVFLFEYMPNASGDAVKVYLYGLFLCQNQEYDQDINQIAKTLNLTIEQVKDCFLFWEEFGLLSVVSTSPFCVQYLPVKNSFNAKPRKYKAEKYTDFAKGIQALLPDRMISTNEYNEYFSIMETYGIKPEAMLMIVKYCADRKGKDIGYHYIIKVAKDFGARGIITQEKVENELSSYIFRTAEIEKILRALSLKRQPEIEDLNLLKKWTEELSFDVENIVYAASKMKKGSMAKLDEFMLELYGMKSFSKEEIEVFVREKQNIYDTAIKINRALSIYMEVIDTVVDTYTKKWLSFGFTSEALIYIASYCFKIGKNTLQYMDALLDELKNKGIIDLTSVSDYFEEQKKTDEFISKLLVTCGINRRPTSWDRENIDRWKSWNFSFDMILEAGKLASGKASPIPYINGILSSWKNSGIYTTDRIGLAPSTAQGETPQEAYNREYERRRNKAVSRAQKNMENAFSIEGFSDIYSRLNSIEKDLAFAEIDNNKELLEKLEEEKKNLNYKANEMLKQFQITLSDLTPKYACPKCHDTGYNGTHRCDCFDLKV
ncbi:MAG: DnaD domain protein [Firmicutes bacterium]|nr:DnaD domain protein [Candidatus Caballimonas caccae]